MQTPPDKKETPPEYVTVFLDTKQKMLSNLTFEREDHYKAVGGKRPNGKIYKLVDEE